jgi:hypothetical protein
MITFSGFHCISYFLFSDLSERENNVYDSIFLGLATFFATSTVGLIFLAAFGWM